MAAAEPPADLVGQRIDDYEIVARLGGGGMGLVYEAKTQAGKRVAIKTLKPVFANDDELVGRFHGEARALKAISHRVMPEILSIGELGDGTHYIVMEFLEGKSFADVIQHGAPLDPREVLTWMVEILDGLEAVHAAGVIHRDLKPSNLFLARTGVGTQVKLIDFGIAKHTGSSGKDAPKTLVSAIVGTPDYMSPEQVNGDAITAASDMYALGCVMFEMLTGKVPFQEESSVRTMLMHVERPAPLMSTVLPTVPRALDELVAWTLSKEPAQRPQTARALRERIETVLRDALGGGEGPAVTSQFKVPIDDRPDVLTEPVIPIVPERRHGDRRLGAGKQRVTLPIWAVGVGAAAVLLAVLFVLYQLTRPVTPLPPVAAPSEPPASLEPAVKAPPDRPIPKRKNPQAPVRKRSPTPSGAEGGVSSAAMSEVAPGPAETPPPLDRAALKLPPEDGDAPLEEVGRDGLSVFLYLAFTDAELGALFQSLRLSIPGFRIDKLSGVQKADHLADEIRQHPDARAAVVKLLRELYEFPVLDDVTLSGQVAERLAVAAEFEDFRILMLWRLLADPQPEVRKAAHPSLEYLAKAFYGGGAAPAPSNAPKKVDAPREGADLEKELARAKDVAEKARTRADELQVQLKAARQDEADANKELSKARKTVDRQGNEISQLKVELDKARAKAKGKAGDRQLREVEHLKEQVQKLEAERDALTAKLEEAAKAPATAAAAAPVAAPADEESDVLEELPRDWLMPKFSNEFYDSLSGWDLRLQRTAFKQAYLLAENFRHPSLRALPLQGLEGYYRVRVATDVRLIYRRHADDSVEILSLIDREDLDRYVRQAKLR
ncbi:MAG: protein kinase [Archangiaceae bacterium]|nr:protein kinase [Archangiaceae bacterium]